MFDKAAYRRERDIMLSAVVLHEDMDAFLNFHKKNNPVLAEEHRWMWSKRYVIQICCQAALILPVSGRITEALKQAAESKLEKIVVRHSMYEFNRKYKSKK